MASEFSDQMSTARKKLDWFGVKSLYRWHFNASGETSKIEERVVLFRAANFNDALVMAEAEAKEYCKPDETANYKIKPIGWWNAFSISEKNVISGAEVYSRLMDTSLSGESFVRRYYPKSHEK